MTEKLFDLDSYCTQFCASVLSCEPASKNGMQGFAVELDRTCFFPEGGGQPADTGCLQAGDQSAQVLYTYEQEEAILHLCDQPLPVEMCIRDRPTGLCCSFPVTPIPPLSTSRGSS